MNSEDFSEFIYSISPDLWEHNLEIGNFEKLMIENIANRKYSYVAKCTVFGTQSDICVYVKHYKNSKNLSPESLSYQVEKEYETIVHYFNKFNESDGFKIVKPIFVFPDKFILATEEAKGENLFQTIIKNGIFFPSETALTHLRKCLFQAGAWIEHFHSLEEFGSKQYSIKELVDYINVRFQILTEDKRRCFPQRYCQIILDFIENNKSSVTNGEKRIHSSHSDYNLSNIVVNGTQITLLDFTKIKQDSFLVDISRIYHQLLLLTFKPQYREKTIQHLQKALLKGFGMEDADRFMLFRFFLIRHTLTHLVGITRFWQVGFKERLYNHWILLRELNFLKHLTNREDFAT